jgi:hypothetical protein
MIIRISAASRSIEIDDPRNFKAFSVRIEGPFDDPAVEAELLGRVASSRDREHAWISERFGWIDEANHSIRAHIEYVP